jgi:hypothetical protein
MMPIEWHGHHDHERMHEALELRREHEEHDEQRDAEREIQCARGLFVFERLAAIIDLRRNRQVGANDVLEILERFAERVARREVRRQRHGAHAVVAL